MLRVPEARAGPDRISTSRRRRRTRLRGMSTSRPRRRRDSSIGNPRREVRVACCTRALQGGQRVSCKDCCKLYAVACVGAGAACACCFQCARAWRVCKLRLQAVLGVFGAAGWLLHGLRQSVPAERASGAVSDRRRAASSGHDTALVIGVEWRPRVRATSANRSAFCGTCLVRSRSGFGPAPHAL